MALATLSAWIIKDQVALTKWIEDKEDPTNKVRRYTCRFQVPWTLSCLSSRESKSFENQLGLRDER
jgi:hypothetical protein